jgi:hypothetical protein
VPVGVVGVMVEGGDMPVGVLVAGVVVVPPPAVLHFEAKYNQHMIWFSFRLMDYYSRKCIIIYYIETLKSKL